MKTKTPKESYTISTEIVLPNDTNVLGNLMGGRLLHWMDITAAISAHRHCKRVVVTASVNHVSFERAIKLGDYVTIEAKVSRAFTTSMEVFIDVSVEDSTTRKESKILTTPLMYLWRLIRLGRPIEVSQITPETDQEKKSVTKRR